MKVRCQHGYFKIEELKAGQVSHFMRITGFDLVAEDGYFTFQTLKEAPRYSIAGALYLGAPAEKTIEGHPWEVLKANGLVYDFTQDLVVPLVTVVRRIPLVSATDYFVSNGMILPGSVTEDGSRVTDYSAFFLFDTLKFKYSDLGFDE